MRVHRNLSATFRTFQDQISVVVVAGMKMKVEGLPMFPTKKTRFADIQETISSSADLATSGSYGNGSLADHVSLMTNDDFQMTDVHFQSGNMTTHFTQRTGFCFYSFMLISTLAVHFSYKILFCCRFSDIRGSSHKYVTKRHNSVNFQNIKNPKYMFCAKFNSEKQL